MEWARLLGSKLAASWRPWLLLAQRTISASGPYPMGAGGSFDRNKAVVTTIDHHIMKSWRMGALPPLHHTSLCRVVRVYFFVSPVFLLMGRYFFYWIFPEKEKQRKSYPCTGLDRTWGFQEFEASMFQDSRYINVVRLLAVRTGHLYPTRNYSWYLFLLEAESTPGP